MMRAFAYAVAVLAAVGIVIVLATTPDQQKPAGSQLDSAESTTAAAADQRVMDQAGTLTLQVPEMHCPVACYPAVKKALESDAAVAGVELTEQEQEGVIDNPQVVIRYDRGFNIDAAIAALAKKGFADSDVVQ